jgi:hypothetical protein
MKKIKKPLKVIKISAKSIFLFEIHPADNSYSILIFMIWCTGDAIYDKAQGTFYCICFRQDKMMIGSSRLERHSYEKKLISSSRHSRCYQAVNAYTMSPPPHPHPTNPVPSGRGSG